jgi:hypothetical protein
VFHFLLLIFELGLTNDGCDFHLHKLGGQTVFKAPPYLQNIDPDRQNKFDFGPDFKQKYEEKKAGRGDGFCVG